MQGLVHTKSIELKKDSMHTGLYPHGNAGSANHINIGKGKMETKNLHGSFSTYHLTDNNSSFNPFAAFSFFCTGNLIPLRTDDCLPPPRCPLAALLFYLLP